MENRARFFLKKKEKGKEKEKSKKERKSLVKEMLSYSVRTEDICANLTSTSSTVSWSVSFCLRAASFSGYVLCSGLGCLVNSCNIVEFKSRKAVEAGWRRWRWRRRQLQ